MGVTRKRLQPPGRPRCSAERALAGCVLPRRSVTCAGSCAGREGTIQAVSPRSLAGRLCAALVLGALVISLPSIAGLLSRTPPQAGAASAPQGINKIKHIVFLVKENRSF